MQQFTKFIQVPVGDGRRSGKAPQGPVDDCVKVQLGPAG